MLLLLDERFAPFRKDYPLPCCMVQSIIVGGLEFAAYTSSPKVNVRWCHLGATRLEPLSRVARHSKGLASDVNLGNPELAPIFN
jgi:hypothetical protein